MSEEYKGLLQYDVGDKFDGYVLVKSSTVRTNVNGGQYINTTLADKTTDTTAMVWDADDFKIGIFTSGNILNISGMIEDYQGRKQIKLLDYNDVTDHDVSLENLLRVAPIDPDEMYLKTIYEVNNLDNDIIKNITLSLLGEYSHDFKMFPAAKGVHHAYVSGLAFHTYSMMNMAKSMMKLYPELNPNLLIAGTVLHDVAKIKDYTGYIGTEMTLGGKLKGHISTISEEIMQTAIALGYEEEEEVLLLQHMVLSHHGKREWGSPVLPQIIEAFVLHQIDKMDASMDSYRTGVQKAEPKEFTERIFGLDNLSFYNHDLNNKN